VYGATKGGGKGDSVLIPSTGLWHRFLRYSN
jgi:hypothetical protein